MRRFDCNLRIERVYLLPFRVSVVLSLGVACPANNAAHAVQEVDGLHLDPGGVAVGFDSHSFPPEGFSTGVRSAIEINLSFPELGSLRNFCQLGELLKSSL